jgi:hypothetical protein
VSIVHLEHSWGLLDWQGFLTHDAKERIRAKGQLKCSAGERTSLSAKRDAEGLEGVDETDGALSTDKPSDTEQETHRTASGREVAGMGR